MRKRFMTVLTATVLLLGINGHFAYAAAASAKASFEVSFGFKVGDKVYPGGHYELAFTEGNDYFSLRNTKTGKTSIVPFSSRTSGRGQCKSCGKPVGEAELVFQQDEGAPYLTDVYMPNSDGFHLGGALGKDHKHVGMQSSN